MVYEVQQTDVTPDQWDEMKKICRENVCADCGAELQIHTVPERGTLAVGCLNKDHHGYIERETYTQAFRRGLTVHPSIQAAIERKMMPKDDLGRAMQLLALRYPRSIENPESAALFIMDCARLDIDPLIQPAEAIPVPFKSKKKKDGGWEEKVTVAMVITDDGWLSMAARGCQDEWNGPPRTMRLEEYLTSLPENQGKPREEIQAIAREIKQSECKDPEAWCYAAIGRNKTMTTDTVVYGFFTHKDLEKAEDNKLPAFDTPGNQARVRARKKFVREVYPDARQRMIELSKEWYERSEGVKAAQEFIDAEYRLLDLPQTEGDEKIGDEHLVRKDGEGGRAQTTILSSPKGKKSKKSAERAPAAAPPGDFVGDETPVTQSEVGEGVAINLEDVRELFKTIKWDEGTAKSWIASHLQVDATGSLPEVLQRLTRAQAETFIKELQDRAAKVQPGLFD